MSETRDKSLDILRGIAIILVVLGHSSSPFNYFVYMFHMALFFICSGVFFKEKYYDTTANLKHFLFSKIKRLYIPFVLWNIFLISIHNFLLSIDIYTNNPEFTDFPRNYNSEILITTPFFQLIPSYDLTEIISKILSVFCFCGEEQFSNPTWFLRVLFWISVISVFIHYFLKKFVKNIIHFRFIRFITYSLLLFSGFLFSKAEFNTYSIGTICSCSILYYFGILYGSYKKFINKHIFLWGILGITGICCSYYCTTGQTALHINIYPNIFRFIFNSLTGFMFILFVSKLMYKFNIFGRLFSYFGQHTISILLFHFIGLKTVIFLQIWLYFRPNYYLLAAYPFLTGIKGWWIIYTVMGVIIPLIISFIWEKIKNFIENKTEFGNKIQNIF